MKPLLDARRTARAVFLVMLVLAVAINFRLSVEFSNAGVPSSIPSQPQFSSSFTNQGNTTVDLVLPSEPESAPRVNASSCSSHLEWTNLTEWDDIFPLTCPCLTGLHTPENKKVAVVYHVGMVGNWKDIVKDQLRTLDLCGLGRLADSFTVVHSGAGVEELQSLVGQHSFGSKARFLEGPKSLPYESIAIKEVSNICSTSKETAVFYFHNKGSSRYTDHWRDFIESGPTETEKYAQSLYWRKAMEYLLLERPFLCLDKIWNKNASICGIMRRRLWGRDIPRQFWHYSGNFWVASCKYVQTLPPVDETLAFIRINGTKKNPVRKKQLHYIAAELWIGWGMQKSEFEKKFFSLFQQSSDRSAIKEQKLSLDMVWPQEYRYLVNDTTMSVEQYP